MISFNLSRIFVGVFWGWFLTDLFKHVGTLPSQEPFGYWDAFGVIGFVLLLIGAGIITTALIVIEE